MTRTGQNRRDYAREVEMGPSKFSPEYAGWCERADEWARARDSESES